MATKSKSKKRGSKETQEFLRTRLIELVKGGKTRRQAAIALGVSYTAALNWYRAYLKKGAAALVSCKRGRKKGQGAKLTENQAKQLKRLLTDKTPDQLKLPFMLWERKAVQQIIERKFALKLGLTTVGKLLRELGFTAQRPSRRYQERDTAEVEQWKKETYPRIKEEAAKEGAEIHWCDEAGLCNRSSSAAKGYSLKGKTPVQTEPSQKVRVNHISSVSNQGIMRFMVYEGSFTKEVLIKFLERFMQTMKGKKAVIIMDNHPVHKKSKDVRQWLEKNKEKIRVEYLPRYSPELNPDEYLNGDVKRNAHQGSLPRTKKELARCARAILRKISRSPKRVRSYFKREHTLYAA